MKKILMLVKRHPVAMLFVVAAWAFIGWQLRHDLTAFAVIVVPPLVLGALVAGLNALNPLTAQQEKELEEDIDRWWFFFWAD